jgi:putative SOS response-associated peptidase YedK
VTLPYIKIEPMCGRYTYKLTWAEIIRLYRLPLDTPARNLQARYNICPTTPVDTIVETNGRRAIVPMRWGLIPNCWAKPLKEMKLATFNARAESVATKPMFRDAFKSRRCLIPASGYYEWKNTPEGKQPYYFTRADGEPMTFAGIWDEWKDSEAGEMLKSCAMLITSPNKLAAQVHDRMPVILEANDFKAWLSGETGSEALKPAADSTLRLWPVSKRVNSSRTSDEDSSLIEPLAA